MITTPSRCAPLWAMAYAAYLRLAPNHPGKWRILNVLYRYGLRRNRPFPWRVRNGAWVAIGPREGEIPLGVGWSCFTRREWEPHLERCFRLLLRPGDCGYDVGANIGYFSAVMAQVVGAGGVVCAFEPVEATYRKLMSLREWNLYDQLRTFHCALGAEPASAVIHFDDRSSGNASLYERVSLTEAVGVPVSIRTMDEVVATEGLPPPTLIKVDTEGAELSVLKGARRTIENTRPTVVVEYNPETAAAAGWVAADLGRFFAEVGGYDPNLIAPDGSVRPVALDTLTLDDRGFVDLCFRPR